MAYEYRVVPIMVRVKDVQYTPETASELAGQVQEVIDQAVKEGWEFYRVDTIDVAEAPGCFNPTGKGPRIPFHQAVFRRERR